MDRKPAFVAANKFYALEVDSRLRSLEEAARGLGLPFFAVSAATGKGCAAMAHEIYHRIQAARGPLA